MRKSSREPGCHDPDGVWRDHDSDTEALEAAREAYVALWIRNAYEDEGGSVDEDAERRAALAAFAERGS